MIKKYNNYSLLFGVPGLIVQTYSSMINSNLLFLSGTVLIIVGLFFYTKAKARHPLFCLLGFLSIIGWLILAALSDKSDTAELKEKGNSKVFLIIIAIILFLVFAIPAVNSYMNH